MAGVNFPAIPSATWSVRNRLKETQVCFRARHGCCLVPSGSGNYRAGFDKRTKSVSTNSSAVGFGIVAKLTDPMRVVASVEVSADS